MQEQSRQNRMYLSGMWKYRWIGVAVSWLVCTAIWTYVYYKPDVYEATGKIQVDMDKLLKANLKGVAAETEQVNMIDIMTNRLMNRQTLERIIRETDLNLEATDKEKTQHLIEHLRKTIVLKDSTPYYGGVSEESIATISFKDPKPKLAYAVVKKVFAILEESPLTIDKTDTDSAHATLQKQIKEYENKLSTAEQKLEEFKKKNSDMEQGNDYNTQLLTAKDKLGKIESELKIARNKISSLKIQLQKEALRASTASYDKKINEHKDKLQTLLLQFTENHPEVQAEKSIIASLEKSKADAIEKSNADAINNATNMQSGGQDDESIQLDNGSQVLQDALKTVEVNVSNLEDSREKQEELIKSLQKMVVAESDYEAQLSKLNRDYETNKLKYSELVSRLDVAQLPNQAFKTIEPPLVPNNPAGPNRLFLNFAALLAGFAAGFGVMFLMYNLKPVFLTIDKLAHMTGLTVLGAVTMIQDDETVNRHRKERTNIYLLGSAQLLVFVIIVLFER